MNIHNLINKRIKVEQIPESLKWTEKYDAKSAYGTRNPFFVSKPIPDILRKRNK